MRKIMIICLMTLLWALSIWIIKINPLLINGKSSIIKDDFILNFNGVFLGLAVAIIALLYSNVEKIRDSISKLNVDKEKVSEFNKDINRIFVELKHDTLLIFYCLVSSFFLIVLKNANLHIINIHFKYLSKIEIFSSLEILTVLLVFVALFDIITSLFKLSEATQL